MKELKKKFMLEAIKLSEKSAISGGGPFGAVVVKNGKIIGKGMNQVTKTNDPTAHAEMVAIRDACKYLKSFQLIDCELYASTEPCPMCLGAIYWARPSCVYFGNTKKDAAKIHFDDAFIYKEIGLPLKNRTIPFVKIFLKESKNAFKLWNENIKKINY